jgi:hypothetical protein
VNHLSSKPRGVQVYDGFPASDFTRMLRRDQELKELLAKVRYDTTYELSKPKLERHDFFPYQLKMLDAMPDLSTPDAYPIPLTKVV